MKTVLLIEDDTAIRENTCELLELEGYRVISAVNGKNVFFLARENKPDIILCDIMMPEVDGYEVLSEIKKDRETASIPFIFVTSSVEKKEVERAFTLGVAGYIKKPFDTRELFNTIANCMIK
jgi:CheY-like chemotaxis protein